MSWLVIPMRSLFFRQLQVVEMKGMPRVVVQEARFDFAEEYNRLKSVSLRVGAVSTFVGTVRDLNEGDDVARLKLEHYPGMTEREISKIIEEANTRWNIIATTVVHRIGELFPGDEIVFAGVSSEHRGDALQACQFIMDYLKTHMIPPTFPLQGNLSSCTRSSCLSFPPSFTRSLPRMRPPIR